MRLVTEPEFLAVARNLKAKVPVPDRIPNKANKLLSIHPKRTADLFNKSLSEGKFPKG